MVYFWLAFLAITLVLAFRRTSWGCCCLLVTRILIPECVRLTPFVDTSLNTSVIGVLLLAAMRDVILGKSKFLKDKYVKSLLLFMAAFFIMLPMADTLDAGLQRSSWFRFLSTDILPAVIFVIAIRTRQDIITVLKVLGIVCIINCLYGCLTIAMGANPYAFVLNQMYSTRDEQADALNALLSTRGGVMTTSSTFEHANGWGYFLPITFVLFFYLYDLKKKIYSEKILVFILILLSVGVVICGKRSAYVSYIAFWGAYLILAHRIKMKYVFYSVFGLLVVFIVISVIPELAKFQSILETSIFFWDDKLLARNDVGGSTMELRINQLFYPWVEIKDNLLFGHGFGWTGVYLSKTESIHPILYGFESIFSEAVCNGGIIGAGLWIWLFFKSFKYSASHHAKRLWPLLFTFTQLMIAIATGLSYFVFYGIYIVILNKLYLLDDKNFCCNRNV